MRDTMRSLTVIGGGLAGSEAAWQAAEKGLTVDLFEMRPGKTTGAHETAYLGELVCSNSLGSKLEDRASGLLRSELQHLGSMLLSCAEEAAVPAGNALAVDRERFGRLVTERVENHPRIRVDPRRGDKHSQLTLHCRERPAYLTGAGRRHFKTYGQRALVFL